MDSDQVIPLTISVVFVLLSVVVSISRSALTRVDARDDAALPKAGVLQGALNAVLQNAAATTFTLFLMRTIFDGIAVGAIAVYLQNTGASQAGKSVGRTCGVVGYANVGQPCKP